MTAAGEGWRALALAGGILLNAVTALSVFTTLVVPRVSSARLLRVISSLYGRGAAGALRLLRGYDAKDRVLALVGPLGIVTLFVAWLALFVVGFGLITWWADGGTLGNAFAVASSSIVTLGVLTSHRRGAEVVEFVTAAIGFLVIALEIAYLPTIYAAYSAREAEVTLLATRAGVPAWGPELLSRAYRFGLMSEIGDVYRAWERWSAAVAESHTNYPTLMWLRSPEPWRSWLTALTATMDAAALHDALMPASAPLEARLCLQVGTNCLRSLAGALHISFDPDPLPTTPIRLTYDEFSEGVERLESAGLPFERDAAEAWRHFIGWRVNYEQIVDALTAVLVPPPAPWFADRPWLGSERYPFVLNRTPDDPDATRPRTAARGKPHDMAAASPSATVPSAGGEGPTTGPEGSPTGPTR